MDGVTDNRDGPRDGSDGEMEDLSFGYARRGEGESVVVVVVVVVVAGRERTVGRVGERRCSVLSMGFHEGGAAAPSPSSAGRGSSRYRLELSNGSRGEGLPFRSILSSSSIRPFECAGTIPRGDAESAADSGSAGGSGWPSSSRRRKEFRAVRPLPCFHS